MTPTYNTGLLTKSLIYTLSAEKKEILMFLFAVVQDVFHETLQVQHVVVQFPLWVWCHRVKVMHNPNQMQFAASYKVYGDSFLPGTLIQDASVVAHDVYSSKCFCGFLKGSLSNGKKNSSLPSGALSLKVYDLLRPN